MTIAAGVRLLDLAKELKMTTAELSLQLKDLGVAVAGGNTVLDTDTANTVREMLTAAAATAKIAEVSEGATLKDVADAMSISPNIAVKKMMDLGQLIAPHQRLPKSLADQLAAALATPSKSKWNRARW